MSTWENATISIRTESDAKLNRIYKEMGFAIAQDAYKFAFSVAVRTTDLSIVNDTKRYGSRTTKYAVGNLDPDGSLYRVVSMLGFPTETVTAVTALQIISEEGIDLVFEKLEAGVTDPIDILDDSINSQISA